MFSKIQLFFLLFSSSSTIYAQFVTWDGRDFRLNSSKFVAVGPNAFWLGLKQNPMVYPTEAQIEEAFIVASLMNSTVIRSHTLGITTGSPVSLRPTNNTFNENAWRPIDFAFTMAAKYNIKLIVPLTDNYDYFHGNYGDFCVSREVPKGDFWTNLQVRQDFKEAISQWLNHVNQFNRIAIKNNPALFMIELGNELGNIRPNHQSTTVPTRDWLADISKFIKTIDTQHIVLNPMDEALGTADEFNIATLDCHSAHFYDKSYYRLDRGMQSSLNAKKPFIVGEYPVSLGRDWFLELEDRSGIKGSLFWSLHPHVEGFNGATKIPHNDGFSLWYPEDKVQLQELTDHFRRMRGIDSKIPVSRTNVLFIVLFVVGVFVLIVLILMAYKKRKHNRKLSAYPN